MMPPVRAACLHQDTACVESLPCLPQATQALSAGIKISIYQDWPDAVWRLAQEMASSSSGTLMESSTGWDVPVHVLS